MEEFTGEIIRAAAAVKKSMERRQHQQAGVYVPSINVSRNPKWYLATNAMPRREAAFSAYTASTATSPQGNRRPVNSAFNGYPQLSIHGPNLYAGDPLG